MKLLATGAAAAVFGALSAVTVGFFTFSNQSRELDIKMVDLALDLLRQQKGDMLNVGYSYDQNGKVVIGERNAYRISREFALRTLSRYSGVPIAAEDISVWANWSPFTPPPNIGIATLEQQRAKWLSDEDVWITLEDNVLLAEGELEGNSTRVRLRKSLCNRQDSIRDRVPFEDWAALANQWFTSNCDGGVRSTKTVQKVETGPVPPAVQATSEAGTSGG